MDTSSKLKLPYIMPSQAQKHVTHNEAIRMLDGLVQLSVVESNVAVVPTSPNEDDCYLIATTATGLWAEHSGEVAQFVDGAWIYHMPTDGWLVWDQSTQKALLRKDGIWVSFADIVANSISELQQVQLLGINTSADAANKLSVSSSSTLFSHSGNDHRLTINKASADDTASVVFQQDWSGRAEFGLAGNEQFTLKTTADGDDWVTALEADSATGVVDFPVGATIAGLPIASGNRFFSGMQLQSYNITATTMSDISDQEEIVATSDDTSLMITMILSGLVRSTNGGSDALAWVKPAYVKNAVTYETYRNHLIGALNTQGASTGSTNSFYLTAPATFILTPAMKDGDRWRPLFLGKCHGAGMVLQAFGFSWTAIEFKA